jgi:pyruvate carboxylase subunit B
VLSDEGSRIIYAAESESSVYIHVDGSVYRLEKATDDQNSYSSTAEVFGAKDEVSTPMPGKIVRILVSEGEKVRAKQALVIVESMKMENKIASPVDAEIKSIHFADGDLVEPGQPIIKLIPDK